MQRRRKATKRGGKKKSGRGPNPQHFPLTRVPRAKALDYPSPPEQDTTLMWYVNFLWVNTGFTYKGDRYYTNAAFSPDIITPSNKPNGFSKWAGMYGSYRVIGYTYELSIVSRELFGGTLLVRHTNTDPGTSSGQLSYCGEALSRAYTIPAAGAPPVKIRGSHTIVDVIGRPAEQDDLLAADVTTIPADLTFLGLFIQCLDNMTTAGFNVSLTIFQRVRFFNRKLVDDVASHRLYRIDCDKEGNTRATPLD